MDVFTFCRVFRGNHARFGGFSGTSEKGRLFWFISRSKECASMILFLTRIARKLRVVLGHTGFPKNVPRFGSISMPNMFLDSYKPKRDFLKMCPKMTCPTLFFFVFSKINGIFWEFLRSTKWGQNKLYFDAHIPIKCTKVTHKDR